MTRCSGSSAAAPWPPTIRVDGWRRLADEKAAVEYPNYGLARRLELISQIIKAGFGTRIYYTALDGFDTHANQLDTHAELLNELSDSLAAFHDDLAESGHADRVAVLSLQRVRPSRRRERLGRHRPRRRGAGLRRRARSPTPA